ncbi:hypothetical protein [Egbenema bharatensis]|uniref:hypothetical protein n=1 Tax=Egbenema bharatensis TaxID=3463334 RepID=UPI003A8875F8
MRHEAPEGRSTFLTVSSVGDIALQVPQLDLKDQGDRSAHPLVPWSDEVVTAVDRLMNLIQQLQASAKEWFNQRTPTPEVLLPYVLDEAQDVWDAVMASKPLILPPASGQEARNNGQIYWLKTLSPWLLWTIARCSHNTMRLLEGQIEQVALPKQAWQTGILRLVPVLTLHTAQSSCCIDLATYQQVSESLPSDRLIRFKGDFCPKPTLVSDFVAQLTQEIQQTTPAVTPFFQGISLPLLIPGQPWQNGLLQFDFAFEFIPMSHAPSPSADTPCLQFTQPQWIKSYTQRITQPYQQSRFNRFLLARDSARGSARDSSTDPETGLALLVEQACWIADRLRHSWTIASRQITHQPWPIEQFTARLMWCLMHSAYEVMQIMTGIDAIVLQPQAEVCAGTLRWIVALVLQTPEMDQAWNLMTGQPIASSGIASELTLSPEALIQTPFLNPDQQLVWVKDLEQKIWQLIEERVPELLLLVQGAEIDMQLGTEVQPAIVRLHGQMILIPNESR